MAKKSNNITSELLNSKSDVILKEWMKAQVDSGTMREDLMSAKDLEVQSKLFLETFSTAISSGNYTDSNAEEFKVIRTQLAEISRTRALQGYSPRETGMYIFSLKDTLLSTLQTEYGDNPALLNEEVLKINVLLDNLGIYTFEAFISGREEEVDRQRRELIEVSTPVIKVWDGILALPIIGTLDSIRSQQVMESLLTAVVNFGYDIVIIDISGVPTVDTITAQHLLKTVSAAKLMGAECIISGIRPEIAMTMVNLGVDFTDTTQTRATMADAVEEGFKLMNKRVINKN